ncbi:hypothetical protein [Candidatus Lokiarchaeum ossiferum]|uniref:hypothetical protein n=1 Tax=Candidatus Lokiarchaeum ossiferum TaxID=2951803 RepID=UPI00352E75D0
MEVLQKDMSLKKWKKTHNWYRVIVFLQNLIFSIISNFAINPIVSNFSLLITIITCISGIGWIGAIYYKPVSKIYLFIFAVCRYVFGLIYILNMASLYFLVFVAFVMDTPNFLRITWFIICSCIIISSFFNLWDCIQAPYGFHTLDLDHIPKNRLRKMKNIKKSGFILLWMNIGVICASLIVEAILFSL